MELAQLNYMLPRLAGRGVEMSQQGGGIGTRGPGETQLETDRRRIAKPHQDRGGANSRACAPAARSTAGAANPCPLPPLPWRDTPTPENRLCSTRSPHAGVLADATMFATLDPTVRTLILPSRRRVLVSDTVGFIRNLPHTLVKAFRATLEEVQRAALVLHVSDGSSLLSAEQDAQVESVLKELDADSKPRLRIMNKIDLLPPAQRESLRDDAHTVHVSAAKDIGISTLLDRIDQALTEDAVSRVRLRIPQKEGKTLALIEARARIHSRKYKDSTVELEVDAPESLLRRLRKFVVK